MYILQANRVRWHPSIFVLEINNELYRSTLNMLIFLQRIYSRYSILAQMLAYTLKSTRVINTETRNTAKLCKKSVEILNTGLLMHYRGQQ